ncbi:hypothetical protein ACWKSP_28350 [Micromonosporaceae bacterium Da 78-11]
MKPISRPTDHGVEVFDATAELIHTFPAPPSIDSHAVTSSADRLAYETGTDVICVDRDGREQWRCGIGPFTGRADLAYAADDTLLWVYAPDRWIALDAATGVPGIEHRLPGGGQGGEQFATPDGRYLLLGVGAGEDGSRIHRAGPGVELHTYPGTDRSLVAVSPDGRQFMTVHHDQQDVAFHTVDDGDVQARVPLSDFGAGDDDGVEWTGGYLDQDTAVVVVGDEESWRHHRVDVRTGEVLGELLVTTIDAYDLRPLGDGTFLVTDTDGTLRRL